ncbi:MAG: hypothetical protein AAF611_14605 [Bacteroidota bacterium]
MLDLISPSITTNIVEFLKIVPIEKVDYLWTAIFSFIITCLLVIISNEFIICKYGEQSTILWAIHKNGDELEKLFKRSVVEGKMMQITLKNDKVYIGFCEIIPEPQKTNYIIISPILSGYRDNKTKKITITTDYFEMVEHYIENLDDDSTTVELNTDIIIKQDEILTAGIYEQIIFDMFNKS